MRSLKSGLFAIAFAGLAGTLAVVGCSADGGSADLDDGDSGVDPGSSGSVVPPKGDASVGDSSVKDSGKKDSGPKIEAGVDAGPPPPVPGTACPTLNAIAQKNCGACGKAETACLVGDAGTGVWGSYGPCNNELAGGCTPGSVVTEDCGNCGKVTKTCTQYCAYSSGACTGQPAMSCVPGAVEYTSASCPASTYRNKVCGPTCVFGSLSATCTEPVNANKMTISATVGQVVTAGWSLAATQVGKKVSGSCSGGGSVSSTATYPWVAVEVKNPTAQAATVQMYHTGTGTPLDTLIWVYNSTLPPTDATLGSCNFGAADGCSITIPAVTDPCGNTAGGGSSLDWAGVDNVVIPAGGKVLVYSAGYGSSELGNFNLNLRTKSLN